MSKELLSALRASIATAAIGLAAAIAAAPVHAQGADDGDTTSALTYCRRSEAALARRPSGKEYAMAVGGVQSCGDIAARALAAEWRRPPSDSTSLQDLAATSSAVRDRRLADVTRDIVMQPSRPRLERLAALATLVAQALPDSRVSYLETSKPAMPGTPPVMLLELVHGPSSKERQALSASPKDVLALVRELAKSDPDEVVRGIASHLAEQIDRKLKQP